MKHATSLERGLSLVELMVGITIGLFIVAASSLLIASQLQDNRRLLAETQLQQDLRASADIITRELRRAGYWARADLAVANPALPGAAEPTGNTYLGLPVTSGTSGSIRFEYQRPDSTVEPFGYRLQSGVIQTKLSSAGWQDLTDRNVLIVEELEITLTTTPSPPNPPLRLPCPQACPTPIPPGETADYCYPTVAVRELTVRIKGKAAADPAVVREVSSRVRLRNDYLRFHFNNGSGLQACPT